MVIDLVMMLAEDCNRKPLALHVLTGPARH